MRQVELEEAERSLSRLVEEAAGGEEIVITRDNEPMARLVCTFAGGARKKRIFGSAKGLIRISVDFDAPLEDFKEYM